MEASSQLTLASGEGSHFKGSGYSIVRNNSWGDINSRDIYVINISPHNQISLGSNLVSPFKGSTLNLANFRGNAPSLVYRGEIVDKEPMLGFGGSLKQVAYSSFRVSFP